MRQKRFNFVGEGVSVIQDTWFAERG